MNLEKLSVEIRPRSPWEAMDLGILLLRGFWKQVFPAWILIAAITFISLHIVTGGRLILSAFLFWWLKPAFDRILLRIFSRVLFNSPPTLINTLRSIPEIFSTGLWINLTLLRFNPSRSFHLPVWSLEGLRGEMRVKRIRTLASNIRSYPLWLTAACQTMEFVLEISPLILLALFIPGDIDTDLIAAILSGEGENLALWIEILGSVFYFLAIVIIEPIYVAAGFMLYIDRRTKLEGWDIELSFRRMASRLSLLTKSTAPMLLITAFICIGATAETQAAPTAQESKQMIEEVLNSKDLNRTQTSYRWIPNFISDDAATDTGILLKLKQLIDYIAQFFRGAIWLVVGIGILILIIYHRQWLDLLGNVKPKATKKPAMDQLFGLDLTPQSLPENIPETAIHLISSGKYRTGLGLLYRASLSRLINHDHLELQDSHTEGDVLNFVKNNISAQRNRYLQLLTQQWQQTAYGHIAPDQKQAILLCQKWAEHFKPHDSTT